ncbi:hypothetical protein [Candidatus Uabimicrobium amorphum]|uniref:Peptidase S74 domain-containing protein n=1 Tax=Uabimicrobium amorphum TaxID=2596890 RepID=A0A5S9F5G4_UABAM|nr:hypothetical protein [Candidatus Uabimicrobium amorphum]BBM86133.1 hypothetical protein UABAM_04519 [Candidatus Uabimicrobium amorphum]
MYRILLVLFVICSTLIAQDRNVNGSINDTSNNGSINLRADNGDIGIRGKSITLVPLSKVINTYGRIIIHHDNYLQLGQSTILQEKNGDGSIYSPNNLRVTSGDINIDVRKGTLYINAPNMGSKSVGTTSIVLQNHKEGFVWSMGAYKDGYYIYRSNNKRYALFADNNCNVGIGTTNPQAKLHIGGSNPKIAFGEQNARYAIDMWEEKLKVTVPGVATLMEFFGDSTGASIKVNGTSYFTGTLNVNTGNGRLGAHFKSSHEHGPFAQFSGKSDENLFIGYGPSSGGGYVQSTKSLHLNSPRVLVNGRLEIQKGKHIFVGEYTHISEGDNHVGTIFNGQGGLNLTGKKLDLVSRDGIVGVISTTTTANIKLTNSTNNNWQMGAGETGYYVYDVNNKNYALFANNKGDLGLGTTNPRGKLHIGGSNPKIVFGEQADFQNGRYAIDMWEEKLKITVPGGGVFMEFAGNSAKKSVKIPANVGLEVAGDTKFIGSVTTNSINISGASVGTFSDKLILTAPQSSVGAMAVSKNDVRLSQNVAFIANNAPITINHIESNSVTPKVHLTQQGNSYFNGGNVGIGTTSPSAKLHVNATSQYGLPSGITSETTGNLNTSDEYLSSLFKAKFSGESKSGFAFSVVDSKNVMKYGVDSEGKAGFGCKPLPGFQLAVNGGVKAREVEISIEGWPDFVFDEGYELASLAQVEKQIKQNRHLPDIPSEAEVKKNGISIGKMQAKLLQKIEELTLYTIDQEKRISTQNQQIKEMKLYMEKMQKIIKKLSDE